MQSWHFECNEIDPFLWLPVENEGALKYLAKVYAHNHPKMHLGDTGCSNNGQSMFKKKSILNFYVDIKYQQIGLWVHNFSLFLTS